MLSKPCATLFRFPTKDRSGAFLYVTNAMSVASRILQWWIDRNVGMIPLVLEPGATELRLQVRFPLPRLLNA